MQRIIVALLLVLGATGSPAFALTFTSTDPQLDIGPNAGTVTTSTLTITQFGIITDLDVWLHITHTNDSDLDVFLQSPGGLIVELFSDVGGTGNNFSNTTLDDSAPTSITAGGAPFNGAFTPVSLLSALDGSDMHGTWTLTIIDDSHENQGKLHRWALEIRTSQVPQPATLVLLGTGLVGSSALRHRRRQSARETGRSRGTGRV